MQGAGTNRRHFPDLLHRPKKGKRLATGRCVKQKPAGAPPSPGALPSPRQPACELRTRSQGQWALFKERASAPVNRVGTSTMVSSFRTSFKGGFRLAASMALVEALMEALLEELCWKNPVLRKLRFATGCGVFPYELVRKSLFPQFEDSYKFVIERPSERAAALHDVGCHRKTCQPFE